MDRFKTKAALATWADDQTMSEVVAFYNGLPGVTPTKRFEDRKIAVNRIWAALGGAPASSVAPKAAKAPAAAPKASKPAKAAKRSAATKAKEPKAARAGRIPAGAQFAVHTTPTKQEIVQQLVARPGGATLGELMEATGWQKHSVRGFIAGTLKKKLGATVESTKDAAGERRYAIAGKRRADPGGHREETMSMLAGGQ
jgi:hypothetical protein